MIRLLALVIVTSSLLSSLQILAQTNSYDGIVLVPSTANNNTFYYGEPFHIYFKISNTKSTVNYYWKPIDGVNSKVYLKNITTGEEVSRSRGHSLDHWMASQLERMRSAKPSIGQAYQGYEYGYIPFHSGRDFGINSLTEKKFRHNLLVYMLKCIPVGDYEMTFEYILYPGNKPIKASYRFKVLDVPADERAAFDRYIRSTEYACRSHFTGDRNYSKAHPDSYENFIAEYPNSIYANHAFMNMVIHIYSNAQGGPSQSDRIEKFEQFAQYYPKLRNNTLKMDFVSQFSRFIGLIPGKDVKNEVDRFLKEIRSDNPEISDKLIRTAFFHQKIRGLINYARDNR